MHANKVGDVEACCVQEDMHNNTMNHKRIYINDATQQTRMTTVPMKILMKVLIIVIAFFKSIS
jgi:hypothetical protein